MSRLNRFSLLAVFAILTMALSAPVFAQGGGAGGRGGQRGQGGQGRQRGGDPAQMMERYKTAMAVSDAEWAVINPLLTIVVAKQSAANPRGMRMGRMGGMGGRAGGRGGAGGGVAVTPPTDPISVAQTALTTTLADPNATNATIQAKLKALRDARTKAQAEYKTACDNLIKVLKPRQEAQLVSMNVIQ